MRSCTRRRLQVLVGQVVAAGAAILLGIGIVIASPEATWAGLLGIFIVAFTSLAFWPLLGDLLRHRFDPFEARNFFVVFFAAYVLPLPVVAYFAHKALVQVTSVSDDAIAQALVLSLLGLLCFFLAYRLPIGRAIAQRIPLPARENQHRLLFSTVFLLLLCLTAFAYFVRAVGGLQAYLAAGYKSSQLEIGYTQFAIAIPGLGTVVALFYHAIHQRRSRALKLFFLILCAGTFLLFLLVGKRRLLLTIMVAMIVYHHYVVKRISWRTLLSIGIIGFFTFAFWGVLRAVPMSKVFVEDSTALLEAVPLSEYILSPKASGIGEFTTAFESFPDMIDKVPRFLSHRYGSSYLQTFEIFIPRFLYRNRPMPVSEWYASIDDPKAASLGGGKGFFFLAEAYLNFGILGPLSLMFLAGIVNQVMYSYLKASKYDPRIALIYGGFISWIPSALRIDFAVASKGFVLTILALLLFVVIYSSKWRYFAEGREPLDGGKAPIPSDRWHGVPGSSSRELSPEPWEPGPRADAKTR